ncbi:hypothetical protein RV14_GL002375 [Enterococcus ratti]|uniref:Uncharacterized protein n=1 Tax=Enterococcus ratti TaxID=150033 RepID=A0A1L8WM49_9ENTE|nr:hypothetical protein RV14_GL002375 [Enterococcus ratti]
MNYQINIAFFSKNESSKEEAEQKQEIDVSNSVKNEVVIGEKSIVLQKTNHRKDRQARQNKQRGNDKDSLQLIQQKLMKLEKEVFVKKTGASTTIFGQQLKSLSGTLLYGTRKEKF